MDDIELTIPERQMAAIRLHHPHARIQFLKKRGILGSYCSDFALMRIQFLQVVRRFIGLIASCPSVEYPVGGDHVCVNKKPFIHASSLIGADPDRETAGR